MVNQAGYYALQRKKFDRAFSFFNLNVENYTGSQNAFDSMGDFYLAKGDTAKAIETFDKALSIKELPHTRKKLDDLTKKK